MEIRKIYFDMDGVLADFDRGVREILGLKPVRQEDQTDEETDLLFNEMKEADHFYYRLKAVKGSLELFNEIFRQFGRDRVEILTGVPNPKREIVQAEADKIRWVRDYLPEGVVVNTPLRKNKINYCHGPEDILIDDFTRNIKDWKKAGGTAILFQSADQVREDIRKLTGQN